MGNSHRGGRAPIGQRDGSEVPRFAGLTTFAHLPRLAEVGHADVAVLGVPFDSGVSYRPGARFGPEHIRSASKLLRPYNPALRVSPFDEVQVADAGDLACTPFDIERALGQITAAVEQLLDDGSKVMVLGGDHTIALATLRAIAGKHGPVAVVHFDAHLDTWDTYFDAAHTHGTPFRRASEEGLLDLTGCMHVGIRGSLYEPGDLVADQGLGFSTIHCRDLDTIGLDSAIEKVHERVGSRPVYVSVDIDVLDPAHAPGTGTPEAGGMSSRELLAMLRAFVGLNVVSADVVEVAPAYDHAEITGVAAAHVAYELLSVMAIHAAAEPADDPARTAEAVPNPNH